MRNIFLTCLFCCFGLLFLSTTSHACHDMDNATSTHKDPQPKEDSLKKKEDATKKNDSYNTTMELILNRQILIMKPGAKIEIIHKGAIANNDTLPGIAPIDYQWIESPYTLGIPSISYRAIRGYNSLIPSYRYNMWSSLNYEKIIILPGDPASHTVDHNKQYTEKQSNSFLLQSDENRNGYCSYYIMPNDLSVY